ncbi:U5 small nuclear ribonucleoprotein TSSC4 [Rhynchophorus ferrugineus]|uniref:U5 small nuclear ribonucleoprotein TSSC4 n=1 Tax=Rhynchophorus ferrugineus TaxID=354439 RepID=A0A834INH8_RHYFE|nr:hypothetical protein GWI33_001891 [Rhynchophorus ferrugineus]
MSPFKLNLGNSEFADRQNKIFGQIEALESNRNTIISDDGKKETPYVVKRGVQKHEMKHFRGKESIFKKPLKTAPRNYINRMPDFKKNPHKWTKYSLEDVQDMTEESNKKSAMDFLKDLEKRRKSEQDIADKEFEETPTKIVFNKHIKRTEGLLEGDISTADKPVDFKTSFRNSTLIMPEYNIGDRTMKKVKGPKRSKPEKGRELKLDHLTFDDDNE